MKILREAIAGTYESNDIFITISEGKGINIDLESSVIKQFGDEIKKVIKESLEEIGVTDANVKAVDKGALDFTVRARTIAAAIRASKSEFKDWRK